MDPLAADIEQLNSRLFLLAQDAVTGVEVLRRLKTELAVIARIKAANEGAICTAVRCGVPLVTFIEEIDELIQDPRGGLDGGEADAVTKGLRDLTMFALQLAQRLALEHETLADMHFGLQSTTAGALTRLGITDLESMSRCGQVLLQLRKGSQPVIWDRLLIGGLSTKAWAFRIAHETALLSSGGE